MAGNLSIRNVEDEVVARLKQRAEQHGRSAEAEVRSILREAVRLDARDDFGTLSAKLRALTEGRRHTPAEVLLREGRDER